MDDGETTIYDLMDWVWSFKWLALAFLLMGTAGSAFTWATTPPPTTQYDVTFQIFSGGTATRTASEVMDIFSSRLITDEVQLVTDRADNPLVFRAPTRALADLTIAAAADIGDQLIQEAENLSSELRPLTSDNAAALEQYIRLRTFLRGLQSELFQISDVSLTEKQVATQAASAWIFPLILSVMGFFLLATFWSMLRTWKRRRSAVTQ